MSALVRIWSGEHHAWWRADRHGYTTVMREAGLYPRKIGEVLISGCGPEKKVELQDAENEGLETDPRDAEMSRLRADLAQRDETVARLRRIEETAGLLRDGIESAAQGAGNAETLRAKLRLLVRAFDGNTP